MELLSNRVLDPFSQGLMEKSMDLLEDLMSLMEVERAPFLFWTSWNEQKEEDSRWEEDDGYKYPISPNGHLSRGSAAA